MGATAKKGATGRWKTTAVRVDTTWNEEKDVADAFHDCVLCVRRVVRWNVFVFADVWTGTVRPTQGWYVVVRPQEPRLVRAAAWTIHGDAVTVSKAHLSSFACVSSRMSRHPWSMVSSSSRTAHPEGVSAPTTRVQTKRGALKIAFSSPVRNSKRRMPPFRAWMGLAVATRIPDVQHASWFGLHGWVKDKSFQTKRSKACLVDQQLPCGGPRHLGRPAKTIPAWERKQWCKQHCKHQE